jgi:hypothetical protein
MVRYFSARGLVHPYTPGGTHPPLLGPGERPELHERAWRAMFVPQPGPDQSGGRRVVNVPTFRSERRRA